MIDWLGLLRKIRRAPEPLRGAPPNPRMKTYSAESGYVYQYFYRGCRAAGETAEYVFQTSADRKNWFPVTVVMPSSSVADFNLSPTERYAVAKMALFQAFNERANPAAMQKPVQIRPSDAATILELLGRD